MTKTDSMILRECCQKAAHEARYAALIECRNILDKELEAIAIVRRVRDRIEFSREAETKNRFWSPEYRTAQ